MREAADRWPGRRSVYPGRVRLLARARGLQARRSDGGFLIRGPAAVEVADVEFVAGVPVARTYRSWCPCGLSCPYIAGDGWLAVIGGTTLPGMTGTLLPILRVLRVPAIVASRR